MFVEVNRKALAALMVPKAGRAGFQPRLGPDSVRPADNEDVGEQDAGTRAWGEGAGFLWGVLQRSERNLIKCVAVRDGESDRLMIQGESKICPESLAMATLINGLKS